MMLKGEDVMSVENGQWIMYGIDADDPRCIHTPDELAAYVRRTGFVPLFGNTVKGFSVEEMTEAKHWWSGDGQDPWAWREQLCKREDILYGKFFRRKAGFISAEWFPYFANARRDGYDFDARYDDGLASHLQKRIMDVFEQEEVVSSPLLKQMAGFSGELAKKYDVTVLELERLTYLTVCDFTKKRNRRGEEYGWSTAVYCKPEHRLGYDYVTSGYREEPEMSFRRIMENVRERYPEADEKAISALMK